MGKRSEALKKAREASGPLRGCTICKIPAVAKEIDALIRQLEEDGDRVGYFRSSLLLALNGILGADIRRTIFARHMKECRPGWNKPGWVSK